MKRNEKYESRPALILQGADMDFGTEDLPKEFKLSDNGYDVGIFLYKDGGPGEIGWILEGYWSSSNAAETLCDSDRIGVDLDDLGIAPWENKVHMYGDWPDGYGVWNGLGGGAGDDEFLRGKAREYGGVHVYCYFHKKARRHDRYEYEVGAWYHGYLASGKKPEGVVLRPLYYPCPTKDYTPST